MEMADFAAAHADDPRVRTLAERMASVQTSEVQEFDQYRAKIAP
ncbi:MAG: hypothetical protein ACXWCM_17600 [Acidimicrobiales bacterium]